EGLAAHQISSLARWTGLRYLSARAITETRKIPSLVSWGQTAGESRPTRRRRPAARACRPRGSLDGSRRTGRHPDRGGRQRPLGPGRGLDRLLRRGDRQGHHLLVAVADEECADRLPELVRGESLPDRHAFGQAAWVAVVAPCDRNVLRQVYCVQEIEPVGRRARRDDLPFGPRSVSHAPEEFDGFVRYETQAEQFVRTAQVESVLSGREVRCLERSVGELRADRFD